MKNHLQCFLVAIFCLSSTFITAQDSSPSNYGIWQTFGAPISKSAQPEIRGRLSNFLWKDIEPSPNVWDWTEFDSDLTSKANDLLPIIFMVYTKQDAPDWLFSNGVPKVTETNSSGTVTGYSPYYADDNYKFYFKRMITAVHQHIETLPSSVRNQIIGVQGCFGNTGDYISYKGTVPSQYAITKNDFYALFKEFSLYMYNEYLNTSPKIHLMSNPNNNGQDQTLWVIQNCPNGWLKSGSLGKSYQLNDEIGKSTWLYDILNVKQSGEYVRSRSEMIGTSITAGWWIKQPYKNMFATMCYDVYWGLDWNNQATAQLNDAGFDSAFAFYDKYAGEKDPANSNHAMCALKDAIDAADVNRFPVSQFGAATKTISRFNSVLTPFIPYGAKLEDPDKAIMAEQDNLDASGTNDVGWNIFPGNYDRYLHQIDANLTSAGYWNVQSSADPNSMYGRFARGFDIQNQKNALFFDLDNSFLFNAIPENQYPVAIDITYLDNGTGSWQLYYDAQDNADKPAMSVTCNNTGLWKKVSVTINNYKFANRGSHSSDFYISNTGTQNVMFSLVELSRAKSDSSNVGFSASSPDSFDTLCVNSMSIPKTFTLNGAFLDGSIIRVGPANGYVFSRKSDGTYKDSITLTNYGGSSIMQVIYIKFVPTNAGNYNSTIPVTGGGAQPINVPVSGVAVNSSPSLTPTIKGISCNGAKDGTIDLQATGGIAPFTYSWTNSSTFKSTSKNITGLSPDDYTVKIGSVGGCSVSATYAITQPAVLQTSISFDDMTCKNGTTTLHVTATGGTLPYSGTGDFTVSSGVQHRTVTDAHGCSNDASLSVTNGTLIAPSKPASISGNEADATGICGIGNFNFSVSPVSSATSYTWTAPARSSISSTSDSGLNATLTSQSTFNGGSISVTANNACGSSVAQTKSLSTIPAKPGPVTGPATVSANQKGLVYSVPNVSGVTYSWILPFGATIVSGANTATITVNWGSKAGNVNAKAVNNCGTSSGSILYVSISSAVASQSVTQSTLATITDESRVFPNPATNVAYLEFNATHEYQYSIELSDMAGKQLQQNQGIAYAGRNQIKITLTGYAKGIYFVTLINEKGERKTFKLVKE